MGDHPAPPPARSQDVACQPDSAGSPHRADGLEIIDLGRLAYAPALAEQRRRHAAIVAGEASPAVLLVEHDPVITISRRRGASQHLLAPRETLAAMGIDVQETDRGGDVTYHGPGQLVVYPIIRLADYALNVSRYMRLLEQIVIDVLSPLGVVALRDACATGVWTPMAAMAAAGAATNSAACAAGDAPSATTAPTAKIAALGVRVSRNVTLHGLALNVTTNLAHFNTIVPCGLLGRAVTSLHQILGERTPPMPQMKERMIASLRRHLSPVK